MDVENEKVYLVAQEAFSETLTDFGISHFGLGPNPFKPHSEWRDFVVDPSVKYVIVSLDRDFSHAKLTQAYLYITENNAEYLAPDVDRFFSCGPDRKIPGTHSLQAGLTSLVEKGPKVIGKPSRFIFEILEEEYGKIDKERTLMIGDSYETDMKFGFNCGVSTALVLTGNAKKEDVGSFERKPDFVLSDISEIL
eukprot:sb/3470994/